MVVIMTSENRSLTEVAHEMDWTDFTLTHSQPIQWLAFSLCHMYD